MSAWIERAPWLKGESTKRADRACEAMEEGIKAQEQAIKSVASRLAHVGRKNSKSDKD